MRRVLARCFMVPVLWCAVSAARGQPGDAPPTAPHWAYVKPVRPALVPVKNAARPKNPIDRFVLARLEKEKLAPSPEAARERLIRRVSLDLIGLPPTIAQVDAFAKDVRPDAYERVVDELLASPHYGERWARHWLDLARYADSNGFQRDGFRTIWPYRDWVIDAFNRDMPFDQFTFEQLAGDLFKPNEPRPSGSGKEKTLPDGRGSLAQKIATGFNRCVTVNVEAGTDREENRVNAVLDRVNTTATVWLGTTLACAQCHHHKYDPFTMTDYYRLFAYFNSTEEETAKGEQAAREFIGPKLTLPADAKTAARLKELQAERAKVAAETTDMKKVRQRLNELDQRLAELAPTTLVMSELPSPRPTHIFKRGNFLNKGKAVTPGVPAALHPLVKDAPPNRLGLARWLVDPDNPLVARVAVNRWWAEFFGHGLVATLEDFGTQSDKPTHPELLDWLAVEFMTPRLAATQSGARDAERAPLRVAAKPNAWSMKHIHRLIVTSATYRQSSRVSAELVKRDPENKLYARGPRLRLDAETIRDNALAVSGLLSRKMGGPPVMPPQPPGIWNVTGVVDNTYRPSVGEDRYRRGLYTIWRRSSPYPSMIAFDAPDRTSCIVKRPRTNTPLQALTLLNDAVYVEAALALARKIGTQEGTAEERIVHGFRACLARQPTEREIALLQQIHAQALTKYQANPAAAKALLQNAPAGERLEPAQWAAWFQVATVLLNLDETITK